GFFSIGSRFFEGYRRELEYTYPGVFRKNQLSDKRIGGEPDPGKPGGVKSIKFEQAKNRKSWIDLWYMMGDGDKSIINALKSTRGFEFWRLFELFKKKTESLKSKKHR